MTTTPTYRGLHPMRPLPCAIHDWFVQAGTTATLAAWWLIMGVLCGVVALVVAWLVVWRDDD